jgi:hypothetical protein
MLASSVEAMPKLAVPAQYDEADENHPDRDRMADGE